MTSWADIYAAAAVYINDIRLDEQMSISPALYYRRMSLFASRALPKLCKPPELLEYLESEKTEPVFGDFEWTSTEESTTAETTLETGLTGFDLCSCIIVEVLDDGRTMQTPYAVDYNAETGEVIFPTQSSAGINYELDFYTDGEFADLTNKQIDLFALGIAYCWEMRNDNDWLPRTPKINDDSFSTVNEANYVEKTSQAFHRDKTDFFDSLKDYEQLCAYSAVVKKPPVKVVLV